jgi:uncharacterized protein YkvS
MNINNKMNNVALTNKDVINRKEDVIYVALHSDGIFEFYGESLKEEEDIKVVSVSEMIEIDDTLKEIVEAITINTIFERCFIGDKWEKRKIQI